MAGYGSLLIVPWFDGDDDDELPDPLWSPGVDDYVHRLEPSQIVGAVGDAVTSWVPAVGPLELIPWAGGTDAKIAEQSGHRYVKMTSVLGSSAPQFRAATGAIENSVTIAMLVRVPTVNTGIIRYARNIITRAGSGQVQLSRTSANVLAAGTATATWCVLIAAVDATTASAIRVNETDTVLGALAAQGSADNFDLPPGTSVVGKVTDVGPIFIYHRYLNSTERATVSAAFAAEFPELIGT